MFWGIKDKNTESLVHTQVYINVYSFLYSPDTNSQKKKKHKWSSLQKQFCKNKRLEISEMTFYFYFSRDE